MRPFFIYCYLLFLISDVTGAFAQQAKAYEKITYTATHHNKRFILYYADGYLAGITLKITEPGRKIQLFTPESGVTDNNGDYVLRAKVSTEEAKLILYDINEDTEAPQQVEAVYHAKHQRVALIFKRADD